MIEKPVHKIHMPSIARGIQRRKIHSSMLIIANVILIDFLKGFASIERPAIDPTP